MTTTSEFQIKPDYYNSEEACAQNEKTKINTNPRYKFFYQTHFTAGDIEQFDKYRDSTNGKFSIPSYSDNDFHVPTQILWEKYQDLDATAVDNTFNYLFHKFKKGIFIKIKNGELKVFLPFSNKNFVNEWGKRIKINPKYGKGVEGMIEFMRHITVTEGYNFFPNKINKFVDTWYSNNCLLRYEFPVHEGDTNVPNASDMFKTLCKERELPDMEFFINRRDFPILKTNGTEPYSHIYDTSNMKLLSHNYPKYSPILSMVSAKNFGDIPIPTGDDWARVCLAEGKFFANSADRFYTKLKPVPWEKRKSIAIFRGASTGAGVTIETNPRLKLAYISITTPKDDDGQPFLDAGITKWNLRPRKIKGEEYLQTIDIKNLPFGLVQYISPQEQGMYKYIINVDGHVASYRLSRELESGSCILLVGSKYKLWYRSMLKAFVHYVPVKSDLSDIVEKIKWCKENDEMCQQIAKNSKKFAATYLTKDGILDYLQKILIEIKKVNGVYLYNTISPKDVQYNRELKFLSCARKTIDIDSFTKTAKVCKVSDVMFKNATTVISEYNFEGKYIVKKKSPSVAHEAFISLATNGLSNFVYIHGFYEEFILTDSIRGQTLSQYIKGNEFKMDDFLLILVQLSLALRIAQNKCEFVHNDLTPWNIIIRTIEKPIIISYDTDGFIYSLQTRLVPVIIDLGRSHIVLSQDDTKYFKEHYGNVNMFSSSTIQDIITLLVTTISDIVSFDLDKHTTSAVITLANFLSRTGYRQEEFVQSGKNGLGDIRFFFNKASKYTELLVSDKYELEKKTPVDFVEYLIQQFTLPVKKLVSKGYEENEEFKTEERYPYTENIFLRPHDILSLLKEEKLNNPDICTLRSISKVIYSKNLKQLKIRETCPKIKEYMELYQEILKFC